jgi:hypothetical protein
MNKLRGWLLRVGEFFGRERRERELAAEMESHLQMHIDENLRTGMSGQEARRQALIKLGGIEQAKMLVRERRGLPMLEVLLQDLRFGVRMLSKNPGFTAVATLTLALGIAANATIFSFVSAVMFRRPPVGDPDHVVVISSINPVSSWAIPSASASCARRRIIFPCWGSCRNGAEFSRMAKTKPGASTW